MRKDEALKKLQAVKAYMTSGNPIWDVKEIAEAFDMAIEALSASKTEMKTGKWQRKYTRPGVYADLCWHCSICGGKFSDTYANMWKYCPDCGSYNGGNNDDNS